VVDTDEDDVEACADQIVEALEARGIV
jgi:hypothetical protein